MILYDSKNFDSHLLIFEIKCIFLLAFRSTEVIVEQGRKRHKKQNN